MKRNLCLAGILLMASYATDVCAQVSNDNEDGVNKVDSRQGKDYVPGQVLLKLKSGRQARVSRAGGQTTAGISSLDAVLKAYDVQEMEQLLPKAKVNGAPRQARAFGGQSVTESDLSQLYKLTLGEEKSGETQQMVQELEKLPEVEFAEPNYKVYIMDTNIADSYDENPFVSQQWYLDAYGVKLLWDKPIVNPTRPVIAIIDTGVDMTHPDIAPNLWTNTAEAEGEEGYDNDGNGFKGDVHGWDFINNTPNVKDFNMHGTHVAGIAAAANNDIGIIGANPMALIMPISVMQSDGTGDVATIVKGIDYAAQNGATVLNLSIGTYANSRAMRQALERAYQTAVIVAAAGNDGRCVNSDHHPYPCYGAAPMFPGAYSFVLGVQATQSNGSLADFSNYDDNGNTFSSVTTLQDPDGFNYELKAPGTEMLSTIPGGKYKVLQGTSMASPLVAGAISALKMVKNYDSQEILWGDLLHTGNIAQAYEVAQRPAELDLMKLQLRNRKELTDETEEDYSGDHEIDAGETVSIYPVIRTTFGEASNIKLHLEMGDYEDPSVVDFLTDEVDFGLHLDAYGKGVALNPLQLKVADNIADNRHIKLKIVARCDESSETFEWPFTIVVTNMVKISGLISEDRTLTADHVYLVNENLGIMEGATLTIEPGTRLEFMEGMGLSSFGKLVADGTPEKPIVFTGYHGAEWAGVWSHKSTENIPRDTISYCKIEGYSGESLKYYPYMKDCIINPMYYRALYLFNNMDGERNVVSGVNGDCQGHYLTGLVFSNIINNNFRDVLYRIRVPKYSDLKCNNYFNNFSFCNQPSFGKYRNKYYSLAMDTSKPEIDKSDSPSYLGTGREDIIRPYIYEIGNAPDTYGQIDLSNMPTRPYAEAHGIVWKVCVNGKDAQDEYEDLAPLGVGKHKFEVYFNRPMNKAVAPQISFGVRDPYTQHAVNEEGSWNEEGTVYTAYKTIDGKTKSDGVNRIYVNGAEDNEYFECPYEKDRFNVMINAAGSMATGFAAEPMMGRVKLTWDNSENNFDDAMGFNVYRYQLDADNNEINNTRINQEIVDIETTEYTDYDVTPGETYYYMYKVLSTDLKEFDASNIVAATPLTSTRGDANGSGEVDVADVITTVNYAAGMEPRPFIFEAADMNVDNFIDILDVVGIIQEILNPGNGAREAMLASTATYTVEDGLLYVESPVALAGVQVQVNVDDSSQKDNISVKESLNGFERVTAWLTDNDMLFMAYNMNGKTLAPGKHALLQIGNADISSLRLSDAQGRNVIAEPGDPTAIRSISARTMTQTGIYNMNGQKLSGKSADLEKLPKGVYVVNGKKVVK